MSRSRVDYLLGGASLGALAQVGASQLSKWTAPKHQGRWHWVLCLVLLLGAIMFIWLEYRRARREDKRGR